MALLAKSIAAKKKNKNLFSLKKRSGEEEGEVRSRRDGLCWGAERGAAVINHGERGEGENPTERKGLLVRNDAAAHVPGYLCLTLCW